MLRKLLHTPIHLILTAMLKRSEDPTALYDLMCLMTRLRGSGGKDIVYILHLVYLNQSIWLMVSKKKAH